MLRITLFFSVLIFSLNQASASVTAYFNYANFSAPEKGPYIETYLSVDGSSVKMDPVNGGKKGELLITMIFKKKDGTIVFADKYGLTSPVVHDTSKSLPAFIDLQRIPLKTDTYQLDLTIIDKNDTINRSSLSQEIIVEPATLVIRFSDITPLESWNPATTPNIFTKNNYDLIPFVSSFFNGDMNDLGFYAEIYDADRSLAPDEKYLVSFYVEKMETGVKVPGYSFFQKVNAKPITPILRNFSLKSLTTGNYYLVLEARDKDNNLKATKKMFFQRSNPALQVAVTDFEKLELAGTFVETMPLDSLDEYLACIRPIAEKHEKLHIDNQLKARNHEMMKKYFLGFWKSRNVIDPEFEWTSYKYQVVKVHHAYGTKYKKGYTTDRGRVYLQYGAPNGITQAYNEPNSYPYEIWHFYKAGTRSNRKFIFFDPNLIGDFELLHADAMGEIQDPKWQLRLQKRNLQSRDIDREKGNSGFGTRADENYKIPR